MAVPDFLCARARLNNTQGGTMLGGAIFEQIGQDLGSHDATMAGQILYASSICRFAGRWWMVGRSKIYVYNPDYGRWDTHLTPNGMNLATTDEPYNGVNNQYDTHSGLYIANSSSSNRALIYCYVSDATFRSVFWQLDPTGNGGEGTWSRLKGAGSMSQPNQVSRLYFYKGVAYGRAFMNNQSGADVRLQLGQTVTGTASVNSFPHSTHFSLDDRLFQMAPRGSTTGSGSANTESIEELISGSWHQRFDPQLPAPGSWVHNFLTDGNGQANRNFAGCLGVLRLGDAAYVFGGGNDINTTKGDGGLMCLKLTIPTPGGPVVKTDITDPVIPAALRPNDAGTPFDPYGAVFHCFVDDQTDPANPVGYVVYSDQLMFSNVGGSTLYQFNGELAEMTIPAVVAGDSRFAYPDAFEGAGAYLGAPPTSEPLLEGYLQGTGKKSTTGVRLQYKVAGDPLLLEFADNDLRLKHGVATGGPFVVGETITGAISLEVGIVTVVNAQDVEVAYLPPPPPNGADIGFHGGEILTGGTSGATAILNISHTPAFVGSVFQVGEVIELADLGSDRSTVVAVNAEDLEVSQIATSVTSENGPPIRGVTSNTHAYLRPHVPVQGRWAMGELVTGGTSGATAVVTKVNTSSLQLGSVTGTFQAGETVTGFDSGATRVVSTVVKTGVFSGTFQIGETVTQAVSGATGVVTRAREAWNGYDTYLALTSITGTFVTSQVITGGTSGATATSTTGELVGLGGGDSHTVRFRYHLGAGPTGKGTPSSPGGICTLVPSSATGRSSSLNVNDVENVTADNTTLYGVEWDFVADGVPGAAIINVKVETVRL